MDTYFCRKCQQTKPIDRFSLRRATQPEYGYRSPCKDCVNQHLRSSPENKTRRAEWMRNYRAENPDETRAKQIKPYGLTLADYDRMLKEQNYGCAICGSEDNHGRLHFSIDHCHLTGKVRGLLCNLCNVGIGNLKDSIDLLEHAIEYLKKNS